MKVLPDPYYVTALRIKRCFHSVAVDLSSLISKVLQAWEQKRVTFVRFFRLKIESKPISSQQLH
jgi:hypothetical protein